MVPPEVPLIAEWTRGSAGGPSGMSIGYAPEPGMPMGGQAGRQPEGGVPQAANASAGNPPSQYATVHIAGRTASMAGASMGQGARPKPQRSSSEGTVRVAWKHSKLMLCPLEMALYSKHHSSPLVFR